MDDRNENSLGRNSESKYGSQKSSVALSWPKRHNYCSMKVSLLLCLWVLSRKRGRRMRCCFRLVQNSRAIPANISLSLHFVPTNRRITAQTWCCCAKHAHCCALLEHNTVCFFRRDKTPLLLPTLAAIVSWNQCVHYYIHNTVRQLYYLHIRHSKRSRCSESVVDVQWLI